MVMPLYVFALLDAPPSRRAGIGLSSSIAIRAVPGGLAAVERRADVPPIAFGPLRAHERAVARLARAVPAILPVRFGTLLEADALEDALAAREEDLARAFTLVRGRVQFTWRAKARSVRQVTSEMRPSASGAEYLRRAARAAHTAPPALFRRAARLGPITAAERYSPATQIVPASLYHLVDRQRAREYAAAARAIRPATLSLSGPFPPYAFTPNLL
jgi:hypothetical protein